MPRIKIFFNYTLCGEMKPVDTSAFGIKSCGPASATRIREEINRIYKYLCVSYLEATE